ncbi:kinase-like domain-containing protein, partial [Choanephora cucurbitarum]
MSKHTESFTSRDSDMSEYDILNASSEILTLLGQDSEDEDDGPPRVSSMEFDPVEFNSQFGKSPLSLKEESIKMDSIQYYVSPIRTNDYQENTYPRNVRRKLSSPNVSSIPAQFNLPLSAHNSPVKRSPSIGPSTPFTDSAHSTPPSFNEGLLRREGEQDTMSLERNVSSLHIALESKKYTRSIHDRRSDSSMDHHYDQYSPQKQSPSLKRSTDEFAIPSIKPSLSKQQNAFSQYKKQSEDVPPREGDLMTVNDHHYTIIKEIGRGASGKVYQVFSSEFNEIFALKWVELKKPEDRQNLIEEIELLSSLGTDENIVTLLDHHISPTVILMVMELGEMDLANLLHRQKKKKWDINFIRYFWNQMLKCVDKIHQNQIVHSDLKPANFVLVKGYLKLIDFGIAKRVADDSTRIIRDTQIGTLNYMSPEALMDMNAGRSDAESLMRLGRPSDVWSLGCILYQMVYGHTPFFNLSVPQKIVHIPNRQFKIPFHPTTKSGIDNQTVQVPIMLIQLLERCLDRTPALRPTLQELMTHPFV